MLLFPFLSYLIGTKIHLYLSLRKKSSAIINKVNISFLGEVLTLSLLSLPYFLKESALLSFLHLLFTQWVPKFCSHLHPPILPAAITELSALPNPKDTPQASSFLTSLWPLASSSSLFLCSCPPLASRRGSSLASSWLAGHSFHDVLEHLKFLWLWPFSNILIALNSFFSCSSFKCQLFTRTLLQSLSPYSLLSF